MHDWNYGFVIDGFPRNERQAEFFLEGYDIDGVIYLDLPDKEVARRVLSRRLCSECGIDYNLMAHRPEREDVCDVCGGALVHREDDNPEALAVRLKEYHEKTKPVLDIFRRKEFVAVVDATRPPRCPSVDPRAPTSRRSHHPPDAQVSGSARRGSAPARRGRRWRTRPRRATAPVATAASARARRTRRGQRRARPPPAVDSSSSSATTRSTSPSRMASSASTYSPNRHRRRGIVPTTAARRCGAQPGRIPWRTAPSPMRRSSAAMR